MRVRPPTCGFAWLSRVRAEPGAVGIDGPAHRASASDQSELARVPPPELSQLGSERHLCAGGQSDNMHVRERLDGCEEEHTRWSDVEACAAHRKANNNFFVSALDLLVDLVIFGKFVPYEVDPVVFRIITHVYESYKGRDKEWESHEQPFVLLSHWSGKVLTKVTASETTDVVEFIADTLKTIKRAKQYKHHIEATDVLRYRLITVDTVDSWK
ncbi:hypothetical protein HPB47_004171 [Ixodes persulcatus]|uniref:Uncharacterized protein n=1 Tax=Ixodes persulcatus TaxID=34615 RepID=A0AC60PHL8_IXOPE|nr:hypothetical protein HPB47_004171 [Ixodes persulcatus]